MNAEVDALVARLHEAGRRACTCQWSVEGTHFSGCPALAVIEAQKALAARPAAPVGTPLPRCRDCADSVPHGWCEDNGVFCDPAIEAIHQRRLAAAAPVGEAERLPRYGVTWQGEPGKPLLTPMPDGYWTPYHVAVGQAERQAFRAGFMAVWHRDDSWTFDGPSAADKEPAAWAAWEAQNRPEASVDADVAAALASPAPQPAATHYDECPQCQQAKPCETMDRLAPAPQPAGEAERLDVPSTWSNERLAAVLIGALCRHFDAGGISHGRSWYSRLAEPARDLLDAYRPNVDVADLPTSESVVRAAEDRRAAIFAKDREAWIARVDAAALASPASALASPASVEPPPAKGKA